MTFCGSTALISTSAMFGNKVEVLIDLRFQRLSLCETIFSWGVAPGLNERRPWR